MLQEPETAQTAFETFLEVLPNKGYRILALCVMPDHVHLVLLSLDGCVKLGRAIGAAKSLVLTRVGRGLIAWQARFRDHIVRCTEDINNQIRYTVNNPVEAGLIDDWQEWPWTYVHDASLR